MTTITSTTTHGQHLPNECLLHVISWLSRDFSTLRSLLTVNKIFFRASVPLLFVYGINSAVVDKEKLLVLILSSIVHYPKEGDLLPLGEDMSSASISNLFRPFELQLVEPVTFPSLLPSGPKPIVDYAKFVPNLPSSFSSLCFSVKLHLIIRVAKHAYTAPRNMTMVNPPSDNPHAYQDVYPIATDAEQMTDRYKLSVMEHINFLLLHHSPEKVKNITVHANDIAKYLPLVTEMSALDKVYLKRDDIIPEPSLSNLLSFIKLNRMSFAYKTRFGIDHTNSGMSMSYQTTYNLEVKRRRLVAYHVPTVAILEAMGRPSSLDVTCFPGFYATCEHVDMTEVELFLDTSKIQPSEVPAQQELIKHATGMRYLAIHVMDPRVFDWCLGQSPQGRWLPKLRTLYLFGDKGEKLFPAMENAIHGFRESPLDDVYVRLKSVAKFLNYAHVFSGWNLPWIRVIRFHVEGLGTLPYLGAFDCPQLEYLRTWGMECNFFCDPKGTSSDNNNSSKIFDPETGILPLAPVWHLPRLKSLKLVNVMAMMFNYDSLAFMPALEDLRLTVCGKKTYARLVPQLMTHVTRNSLNSSSSEVEKEASSCSNSGPNEQQQTQPKWPGPWRLLKLKRLVLTGPPALVFSFDWLRACPKLEYMEIGLSEDSGQRLPLSWDSPTALIPLSDLDATGASQSSQQDLTMEPMYMASKLRHFVLHGNWQMSKKDLIAALTDYMPNLTKLELHQVNVGVDTSHILGFKVFEEVDRIHLNRGRCSRLMDVRTSFVPDAAAKTRVGLVSVPVPNNDSRNQGWRHELRGSRTVGYRVYIIDQQYLTTKEPTIEL